MSSILLNWLNDEIHLSQRISTIDEESNDFVDGYLLGEILYRYNQQANFNQFIHEDSPNAKVNNFCLLLPALRAIGVHFDSRLASDIMNSKSTAVKGLLYDIKTSLDRIKRSNQSQIHLSQRNRNNHNDGSPLSSLPLLTTLPLPLSSSSTSMITKNQNLVSVVPCSKPQFEKTIDHTFKTAIRAYVENPKEVVMSKVTKKFDLKRSQFMENVQFSEAESLSQLEDERHQYSDQLRSRKRHEKLFNEAWDHMNIEQWKLNQKRAHDRRDLRRRLQLKSEEDRYTKRYQSRLIERDHTIQSIDNFEKKLDSEIFKESSEEDDVIMSTLIRNSWNNYQNNNNSNNSDNRKSVNEILLSSLQQSQRSIKDHHNLVLHQRHLRDRHRSKFISEQESAVRNLIHHDGDNAIHIQLLNSSKSESKENDLKESVLIHQQIIQENRNTRDNFIDAMNMVMEDISNQNKQESLRREKEWVISERLNSQYDRVSIFQEAKQSAESQQVLEFIGGLVDRMISITEWIASYKDYGLYGDNNDSSETNSNSNSNIGSSDNNNNTNSNATTTVIASSSDTTRDNVKDKYPIPTSIWQDAMRLYESNLDIAIALPPPVPVSISMSMNSDDDSHGDNNNSDSSSDKLPYSLSNHPLCLNTVDWLNNKTIETKDVMQNTAVYRL